MAWEGGRGQPSEREESSGRKSCGGPHAAQEGVSGDPLGVVVVGAQSLSQLFQGSPGEVLLPLETTNNAMK